MPNLVALATLEAWAYVVRPTNSLVLLGTAVYLLLSLRGRCWPFVPGGGNWAAQRLVATLNGQRLQTWDLDRPQNSKYELPVPAGLIEALNTLRFDLPEAASPVDLEKTGDHRQLGIAVTTLRWRGSPTP